MERVKHHWLHTFPRPARSWHPTTGTARGQRYSPRLLLDVCQSHRETLSEVAALRLIADQEGARPNAVVVAVRLLRAVGLCLPTAHPTTPQQRERSHTSRTDTPRLSSWGSVIRDGPRRDNCTPPAPRPQQDHDRSSNRRKRIASRSVRIAHLDQDPAVCRSNRPPHIVLAAPQRQSCQ